jgi:thiol-disulfide isomerase/thioredoxin
MTGWILALALALAAASPGPDQWMNLGREFLEQRVYDQALRAYDSALEASGGPCAPCDLGAVRALILLGRPDEAVERARRALKQVGDDTAEARLLLGRALLGRPGSETNTKAVGEAIALFHDLLEEGTTEAGLYLGEALARKGEDTAATTVLREYLASAPDEDGAARAKQLIALPHCGRRACLPAFEIEAIDGTVWNNERMRGRVVLLDFWASWCAPCIEALPELRMLAAERSGRPFLLLSFSADSNPEELARVIEAEGLTWPQIRDEDGSTIVGRFGVRLYPTYLVVDREGIVRGRYNAEGIISGDIETRIDELLIEGGSAPAGPSHL